MGYTVSLDRDAERGLDRYTIAIEPEFETAQAHELAIWMSAAALNPTATFTLDIGAAEGRALDVILARTAWLRSDRRVEMVSQGSAGSPAVHIGS